MNVSPQALVSSLSAPAGAGSKRFEESRLPVERGDVLAALAMTEQVVMSSHERLQDGAVTAAVVTRASVARKQAFLDAVGAIEAIPRSLEVCQRAALDALSEGLLSGALDAAVAISTVLDASVPRGLRAVPSCVRDLAMRGVDAVQMSTRRQKRAAVHMIATAAAYPLLSCVSPVRSWRDFLSTVFAIGYGIASSDASLLLVAHERPALLLGG